MSEEAPLFVRDGPKKKQGWWGRASFSLRTVVVLAATGVVGAVAAIFITRPSQTPSAAKFSERVKPSSVVAHLQALEDLAYAHPSGSRSIMNAYPESAEYIEQQLNSSSGQFQVCVADKFLWF